MVLEAPACKNLRHKSEMFSEAWIKSPMTLVKECSTATKSSTYCETGTPRS